MPWQTLPFLNEQSVMVHLVADSGLGTEPRGEQAILKGGETIGPTREPYRSSLDTYFSVSAKLLVALGWLRSASFGAGLPTRPRSQPYSIDSNMSNVSKYPASADCQAGRVSVE